MKINEILRVTPFDNIFVYLLDIGVSVDDYEKYEGVYLKMCKSSPYENNISVIVKNAYDVIGIDDSGKETYLYYCLFQEWGSFKYCRKGMSKEKYLACVLFEATYISFKDVEILDGFMKLMGQGGK